MAGGAARACGRTQRELLRYKAGLLSRILLRCAMMFKTIAFLLTLTAATTFAGELSPKDVVAQLYKAYGTEQSSAGETRLFSRYFDDEPLKLYLKDKREAKGEVGRLDGDPLYNAQEVQITDFSISAPKITGKEALVTVRFKNIGKSVTVECVLRRTVRGRAARREATLHIGKLNLAG